MQNVALSVTGNADSVNISMFAYGDIRWEFPGGPIQATHSKNFNVDSPLITPGG